MKVLITGFEPNNDGLNASEIVVNALQSSLPVALAQYAEQIFFQVLPGDSSVLGTAIEDRLSSLSPDICIGIGQARGYNQIAIERMAKNLRYFVTPDRAGNTPKGEPIIAGAPIAYWHSLGGIDNLILQLKSHIIPARITNDCGTHLCNQAFYHFLHWRANRSPDMNVGFVHIPALPEQVIKQWPEAPSMSLGMTCKALSLVVESQIQARQR